MEYSTQQTDLDGLAVALAHVLNTCQMCGQPIARPANPATGQPVEAFAAKFALHRCPWDRREHESR